MHKLVLGSVALSMLLLAPPPVAAHPTGHESRTPADCQKLPTPERQHCLKCVSRPVPHHYHPDYPAGARCRPNDGKP